MPRLMLSNELWSKLETILLQEAIYNKRNLRMTVEGMLYRMRVGCPWRDLPKAFGCWNSIYKRFNAWSLSSKWLRIFKALAIDANWGWEFIDGSYVKAHQHSAGAADKKRRPLVKVVQAIPQRSIWLLMVMACQLRLKSPAERSMIVLQHLICPNCLMRKRLLRTRAMIANVYGNR